MSDDPFRIFPEWPDTVVYEEGGAAAGRSIRFDTRSMAEPPQVCVADAARWAAQVPDWAAARRDAIVARLRDAKCVVVEIGAALDRTLAPDGSFAVEQRREDDERTGPWETLRIVTVPEGVPVLETISQRPTTGLRFPDAGVVVLRLVDRGAKPRDVRVDVPSRTFRIGADGAAEPLELLLARLGWVGPAPLFTVSPQSRKTGRAMAFLGAFVCAVFVAGGAWMSVAATTTKDRWTGLAGAAFFALCAWAIVPRGPRGR